MLITILYQITFPKQRNQIALCLMEDALDIVTSIILQ